MAFANLTSTPTKYGRGRFQVSEGTAPSEHILPDEDLATLMQGNTGAGDEFFEVVMVQGTIISAFQKTDGRYVATYCRGLAGCLHKQAIYTTATDTVAYEDLGHAAETGEVDLGPVFIPDDTNIIDGVVDGVAGSLGQAAKPIGVLAKDAFRPFATGDNEGVNFITRGYVEWPLVTVKDSNNATKYDNTNLVVGCYVKPDALGRPVKFREGVDPEFLRIGQVIAREDLGATATGVAQVATYDYGMLNYMQLPVDVFENALVAAALTTSGIFGVKPNLSASDAAAVQAGYASTTLGTTGCIGAVRVNLINM
jgi:hypothetical protein